MDVLTDRNAEGWLVRRAGPDPDEELWRPVLARSLPCLPLITDARVSQVAARAETGRDDTVLPVARQIDVDVPETLAQARVRTRVRDLLVGRACAQLALQQAGASSNQVGASPSRAPIWPEGWTGSLSHAAGIAWAVAARCSDFASLGIDLEHLLTAEAVESVHSVALTPGERRFEAWNDPGDVAWRTTVLFSAKESIFKCMSPLVKEFIEFTEMELASVDPVAGHLRFTCLRQLSPWIERGQQLDVRFTRMGDLVLTATGWPLSPSCLG
jgi:enterobactin synthetase component D